MEIHDVAKLFPQMNPEDYEQLKSDIEQNGLREPIVLFDGKIIDGRQRHKACREVGVDPRFKEWDRKGSLVAFAVSLNLHRRHLTISQRSMVAVEIKEMFEKEARERQGTRTDLRANLRGSRAGKASEHAARIVNVSPRSVESANKVKRQGVSELVHAVKSGEVSVSTAATIAALPPDEQTKVALIRDKKHIRKKAQQVQEASQRNAATSDNVIQDFPDIARIILDLLKQAAKFIQHQDVETVVTEFFRKFPLQDAHAEKELEEHIIGASLFCEIYRMWNHRHESFIKGKS
jgi:ParB-like chromosome segregation protein Spo0J